MSHFKENSTDMSAISSCATTEEIADFLHEQQLANMVVLAAVLMATGGSRTFFESLVQQNKAEERIRREETGRGIVMRRGSARRHLTAQGKVVVEGNNADEGKR